MPEVTVVAVPDLSSNVSWITSLSNDFGPLVIKIVLAVFAIYALYKIFGSRLR
jgi:hypothetical protein